MESGHTPTPGGFGGRALGDVELFSASVQDRVTEEARRRRDEDEKIGIEGKHFLTYRQEVAAEWFEALDAESKKGWQDASAHDKEQRQIAKESLAQVDPSLWVHYHTAHHVDKVLSMCVLVSSTDFLAHSRLLLRKSRNNSQRGRSIFSVAAPCRTASSSHTRMHPPQVIAFV